MQPRILRPCRSSHLSLIVIFLINMPTSAQDDPEPKLAEETKQQIDMLIESVHEAKSEIDVTLQQAKLIRTRYEIKRAAVADPGVVGFVPYGAKEVELIGKTVGATTVTLWGLAVVEGIWRGAHPQFSRTRQESKAVRTPYGVLETPGSGQRTVSQQSSHALSDRQQTDRCPPRH